MKIENSLTRRGLLYAVCAGGSALLIGCDNSAGGQTANSPPPETDPGKMPGSRVAMTVYRDPGCGCCKAWAEIARNAGFRPEVVSRQDMPAIKQQYGIPEELASCHTTLVGGYVVEGHVPIADVRRLLAAGPARIKGIAVAGMPIGSPGMEAPDGTKQPFAVMAFDEAGRITRFKV